MNLKKEQNSISKKKLFRPSICILSIFIVLVILTLLFWIYIHNVAEGPGVEAKFPMVEIQIIDNNNQDQIIIAHLLGKDISLSNYNIIIKNNSNKNERITLIELKGKLTLNNVFIFQNNSFNFNEINYQDGISYDITFVDIRVNEVVIQIRNIICESQSV